MTPRDSGRPVPEPVPVEVTGASDRLGDVLESEPARRPPRITAGLALVLVLAAAAAGYLVGSRHPVAGAKPATPSPSAGPSAGPAGARPIGETGKQCSVQTKDRLQLGIEIVNQSATTMTLGSAQAVLPLRGLRPTATTWGSCGQLPAAAGGGEPSLAPGATTWLAITFDVLVPCPAPYPVQFAIRYTEAGDIATARLPGFPDLGGVPYTSPRCPPASS